MESACGDDFLMQGSEHGVVLEQVRQGFRIGKIVHRDEFDVLPVEARPDDVPANAAEAINANFHCHVFS